MKALAVGILTSLLSFGVPRTSLSEEGLRGSTRNGTGRTTDAGASSMGMMTMSSHCTDVGGALPGECARSS